MHRELRALRVAAVGDVHVGHDAAGKLRAELEGIAQVADLLILAGDLTQHGTVDEGLVIANDVRGLPIPVIAVLGNHDYHAEAQVEIRSALELAGAVVLEGEAWFAEIAGRKVAIAGMKGFGTGFAGGCATEFGEPEMKAFVRHARLCAAKLSEALARTAGADARIAVTHYAPIKDTLAGERPEIFPFLGSYMLGEAIDAARCDLAIHGHAHAGIEWGITPGGVPVRNVARPVIRRPYQVYEIPARERSAQLPPESAAAAAPR